MSKMNAFLFRLLLLTCSPHDELDLCTISRHRHTEAMELKSHEMSELVQCIHLRGMPYLLPLTQLPTTVFP